MENTLHKLLRHHDLKLLLARDRLRHRDEFHSEQDFCGWELTSGDWHVMTPETNADLSLGLDGALAISTMGCWAGGTIEKVIEMDNYGEISFEHYVQNNPREDGQARAPNTLRFYIDDQVKLEIQGPSPWFRCEPVGLSPGVHRLKFEYELPEDNDPMDRKGVVDTVIIWEARDVSCLITNCTPPYPEKNLARSEILRGYSAYQEMTKSDTRIEFTAAFDGMAFHDFMVHANDIFYFVDEFGICYRGIFDGDMEPQSVSLKTYYLVDLSMIAASKAGVGFC